MNKHVFIFLLVLAALGVYSFAAPLLAQITGISVWHLRFLGVILVLVVGAPIYVRREFRETVGWLYALQNRLNQGEQEAYLKELLEKRQQGDRSLETTISISFACRYLERGQEAEWYARQACAEVENSGLLIWHDQRSGLLRDMAYTALGEAWVVQGRFAEAAHLLYSYIPHAYQRNHVTALAAWQYFLAGDSDHARAAVAQMQPPNRFRSQRVIRPEHQLLVAYMQHTLLQADTLDTLRSLDQQMQSWSGELHLHRKSEVYRARLDEVLKDICTLLPLGWYHRTVQLLLTERTDELRAEASAQRASGDHSYRSALMLSAAYSQQGQGAEAEPLAREALAAVQAEGWFHKKGPQAQFLCDQVWLAVDDALEMQGRLAEAARFLMPRIEHAEKPNFLTLIAAKDFFLADDCDSARKLIAGLKPVTAHPKRYIIPKYQLLAAYLQYKVLGQDTRERMRFLHGQLALWDEELARYPADHPYGTPLRRVVEDMRSLAEETGGA